MPIPQEIVQNVTSGKCILFLGAMASAAAPQGARFQYVKTPPGGGELSRRLALKCVYPDQDVTNLQRVSLYFEFGPKGSRNALVQAIREETTKFKEVGVSGGVVESNIEPSPALHMLAALPFPIVITTNYDHLFDTALYMAKTTDGRSKHPILRVYDPDRVGPPEEVPLDPCEHEPILLKLHGDLHNPGSIVVTEEDYLVFIQKMSNPHHHPIPRNIQARMNSWPILFIGYSLKDYNLRLLFRTLRWHLTAADFPLSFSVDPFPDDLIVSIFQRGGKPMVSFVEENLWDFVPALYQACKGVEYPS